MITSQVSENFETKIAYFYGATDETPIKKAYTQALKEFENNYSSESVISHFELAYMEILKQTGRIFDVHQAALHSFNLLQHWSFEDELNERIKLYSLIFYSDSPNIEKAAFLRTTLYQYKAKAVNDKGEYSEEDRSLMLQWAKRSEELLNSLK